MNPWTTLALARAQALAGNHAFAVATMASLAKQSEQFVSGYDRAAVCAALGRTDDAFAALEEAYQSRAEWMSYLKVDPQMDSLRRDPRYATLLKRVAIRFDRQTTCNRSRALSILFLTFGVVTPYSRRAAAGCLSSTTSIPPQPRR